MPSYACLGFRMGQFPRALDASKNDVGPVGRSAPEGPHRGIPEDRDQDMDSSFRKLDRTTKLNTPAAFVTCPRRAGSPENSAWGRRVSASVDILSTRHDSPA